MIEWLWLLTLVPLPAGAAALAVWRAGRRRRAKLDEIARALGMVRAGGLLLGDRDGLKIGLQSQSARPNRNGYFRLFVRFEPPLDLGLCIHERGVASPNFGQGTKVPVLTGASKLDMMVTGDDILRAGELLSPEVCDALRRLSRTGTPLVSDAGATVTAGVTASTSRLLMQFENLIELGRAVHAQRSVVSPAAKLFLHRSHWQRYATNNRLALHNMPLCMFGSVAGATVYAYSVRTGPERYEMDIWLRWGEPLNLGLLVQPTRTVDRVRELFGEENIRIGADLFDRAFTVRASNIDGARALLDDEVCEVLLSMQRTLGPLTMSDDGLSTRIPRVPHVPTMVAEIVSNLLKLGAVIESKQSARRGAYR